jgi:hypothetical protein
MADDIQFTAECAHEAVILRAYCESRFTVGESTKTWRSLTGESYTQLTAMPFSEGFESAEIARLDAQRSFDEYSKDKSGILYWRIVPEIALSTRRQKYSYYMRLLISDKPRIT